jgi:hypothetical protein
MMQEGTNNSSLSKKYRGEEMIFLIHKTMVETTKKGCKLLIKSLQKINVNIMVTHESIHDKQLDFKEKDNNINKNQTNMVKVFTKLT